MKFPMISGVMITYNEVEHIDEILTLVTPHVDEMVVLDGGSTDGTVEALQKWSDDNKIRLYKFPYMRWELFGDQKNLACSFTKGRWIFLVDPDERFEEGLLEGLSRSVAWGEENEVECLRLPRRNFLDGVQTDVYPDYQLRLFRSYCRWVYRVHEELVGFKGMQGESSKHILHYKTTDKQHKQIGYYEGLISRYGHTLRDWDQEDAHNKVLTDV